MSEQTGNNGNGAGSATEAAEQYALETRAETLRYLSTDKVVRRGESDRLEVGRGEAALDMVSGEERVEVGGDLNEHTGRGETISTVRQETTVDGHMTVEAHSDTTMLGGAMQDIWKGGVFVAAGMSDDLVAAAGSRMTAGADLWLNGLTGMEEKPFTMASDGALVEIYGTLYEREYAAGHHNAGAALFSGAVVATQATGFRPMMKVAMGVRNVSPGGGGGGGGGADGPPPATPAATDGGAASGTGTAAGAADGAADSGELVSSVGVRNTARSRGAIVTDSGRVMLRADTVTDALPARHVADTEDVATVRHADGLVSSIGVRNTAASRGAIVTDSGRVLLRADTVADADSARHVANAEDAATARRAAESGGELVSSLEVRNTSASRGAIVTDSGRVLLRAEDTRAMEDLAALHRAEDASSANRGEDTAEVVQDLAMIANQGEEGGDSAEAAAAAARIQERTGGDVIQVQDASGQVTVQSANGADWDADNWLEELTNAAPPQAAVADPPPQAAVPPPQVAAPPPVRPPDRPLAIEDAPPTFNFDNAMRDLRSDTARYRAMFDHVDSHAYFGDAINAVADHARDFGRTLEDMGLQHVVGDTVPEAGTIADLRQAALTEAANAQAAGNAQRAADIRAAVTDLDNKVYTQLKHTYGQVDAANMRAAIWDPQGVELDPVAEWARQKMTAMQENIPHGQEEVESAMVEATLYSEIARAAEEGRNPMTVVGAYGAEQARKGEEAKHLMDAVLRVTDELANVIQTQVESVAAVDPRRIDGWAADAYDASNLAMRRLHDQLAQDYNLRIYTFHPNMDAEEYTRVYDTLYRMANDGTLTRSGVPQEKVDEIRNAYFNYSIWAQARNAIDAGMDPLQAVDEALAPIPPTQHYAARINTIRAEQSELFHQFADAYIDTGNPQGMWQFSFETPPPVPPKQRPSAAMQAAAEAAAVAAAEPDDMEIFADLLAMIRAGEEEKAALQAQDASVLMVPPAGSGSVRPELDIDAQQLANANTANPPASPPSGAGASPDGDEWTLQRLFEERARREAEGAGYGALPSDPGPSGGLSGNGIEHQTVELVDPPPGAGGGVDEAGGGGGVARPVLDDGGAHWRGGGNGATPPVESAELERIRQGLRFRGGQGMLGPPAPLDNILADLRVEQALNQREIPHFIDITALSQAWQDEIVRLEELQNAGEAVNPSVLEQYRHAVSLVENGYDPRATLDLVENPDLANAWRDWAFRLEEEAVQQPMSSLQRRAKIAQAQRLRRALEGVDLLTGPDVVEALQVIGGDIQRHLDQAVGYRADPEWLAAVQRLETAKSGGDAGEIQRAEEALSLLQRRLGPLPDLPAGAGTPTFPGRPYGSVQAPDGGFHRDPDTGLVLAADPIPRPENAGTAPRPETGSQFYETIPGDVAAHADAAEPPPAVAAPPPRLPTDFGPEQALNRGELPASFDAATLQAEWLSMEDVWQAHAQASRGAARTESSDTAALYRYAAQQLGNGQDPRQFLDNIAATAPQNSERYKAAVWMSENVDIVLSDTLGYRASEDWLLGVNLLDEAKAANDPEAIARAEAYLTQIHTRFNGPPPDVPAAAPPPASALPPPKPERAPNRARPSNAAAVTSAPPAKPDWPSDLNPEWDLANGLWPENIPTDDLVQRWQRQSDIQGQEAQRVQGTNLGMDKQGTVELYRTTIGMLGQGTDPRRYLLDKAVAAPADSLQRRAALDMVNSMDELLEANLGYRADQDWVDGIRRYEAAGGHAADPDALARIEAELAEIQHRLTGQPPVEATPPPSAAAPPPVAEPPASSLEIIEPGPEVGETPPPVPTSPRPNLNLEPQLVPDAPVDNPLVLDDVNPPADTPFVPDERRAPFDELVESWRRQAASFEEEARRARGDRKRELTELAEALRQGSDWVDKGIDPRPSLDAMAGGGHPNRAALRKMQRDFSEVFNAMGGGEIPLAATHHLTAPVDGGAHRHIAVDAVEAAADGAGDFITPPAVEKADDPSALLWRVFTRTVLVTKRQTRDGVPDSTPPTLPEHESDLPDGEQAWDEAVAARLLLLVEGDEVWQLQDDVGPPEGIAVEAPPEGDPQPEWGESGKVTVKVEETSEETSEETAEETSEDTAEQVRVMEVWEQRAGLRGEELIPVGDGPYRSLGWGTTKSTEHRIRNIGFVGNISGPAEDGLDTLWGTTAATWNVYRSEPLRSWEEIVDIEYLLRGLNEKIPLKDKLLPWVLMRRMQGSTWSRQASGDMERALLWGIINRVPSPSRTEDWA